MFQLIRYQCAGDEAASPTPADESAVASLPRAQDEGPGEVKVSLMQVRTHLRSMQVKRQANRRHSLVALCEWSLILGTARGADTSDNDRSALRRAPAMSHCALVAALAHKGAGQQDSVAFHQAAKRNPLRQILWCRMGVPTGVARRLRGLVQVAQRQDQMQPAQAHPSERGRIRWCAWAWDGACVPIRDGGSTPIAPGFARTPGPTGYENTSDLCLAPGLHQQAYTRTLPDGDRDRPHRQE
jgi:hypothetical protein